jgi:hypothetical protein
MIEDLPPLPVRDADALALAACYRLGRAYALVLGWPCPVCGQVWPCPCDLGETISQPSEDSGERR